MVYIALQPFASSALPPDGGKSRHPLHPFLVPGVSVLRTAQMHSIRRHTGDNVVCLNPLPGLYILFPWTASNQVKGG
jgi:hypothetical protein